MSYNPPIKTSPGELLKKLRIRTGLTQAELGALVPISEKMIRNWETDTNLPKAGNLIKLIEIFWLRQVFIAGTAPEEALDLWNAVKAVFDATTRTYNEYPGFDEGWFADLTRPTKLLKVVNAPPVEEKIDKTSFQDWGEAPGLENFHGRERELDLLKKWLVEDGCRLVALLGMGGIGKTTLSVKLTQQVSEHFDVIIWRTLRNAPQLETILDDTLEFLTGTAKTALPEDLNNKISLLIDNLRKSRCLIVLDNAESILQEGEGSRAGHYRKGYEGYGRLIERLGQTNHAGCLVITSREKPREFNYLGGNRSPVRVLNLTGLDEAEAGDILADKGLVNCESTAYNALIERYSGNPLALKIVAEFILDVFNGQIDAFLKSSRMVFGDINDLLSEQFERLNELEKQVMYWLAVEREPVLLETLAADLLLAEPDKDMLETLSSLRRRSLAEAGEVSNVFTLQPVVMEFVTDRFTRQICQEIESGQFGLLTSHAVMKAQAREYVRKNQIHFILKPVLAKLTVANKDQTQVRKRLLRMVDLLRVRPHFEQGYAGGNLVNLLYHLTHDLRDYDFSGLNIWQAHLQGINLQRVNFGQSDLTGSVFTDTFNVIWSVAFSPDGKYLAAGGINGEVRFWRLKDGQQIETLTGHTDWVASIAFSPDGKLFVSGSHDRTLKFWDLETGRCLKTIVAHDDMIWSIALSPDGQTLASAGKDHLVKLWDMSNGNCLATLKGHTNWVNSVAFSPDGRLLASGSNDQTIKLWEVESRKCQQTIQTGHDMFWSVAFSRDSKLVAGCGNRPSIGLWEVGSGRQVQELKTRRPASVVYSIVFSPDGQSLFGGSKDGTLYLWDLKSGSQLKSWPGHHSWVRSVAFSPDGRLVASCGEEQNVKVWDMQTALGESYRTLQGYSHRIGAVTFSPDGRLLASGGDEQVIRLWEIESNATSEASFHSARTIPWQTSFILSLQFSADGEWLVGGSYDWSVKLWKTPQWENPRTLRGEGGTVWGVAFSPDKRWVAGSDYTNTIMLWDVTTGETVRSLAGHKEQVWSVAFSPDGRLLASASDDQTARLWNIESGACLAIFEGHKRLVWQVAFSPDGQHLASASDDGTIRLWDIASQSCFKVLEGHRDRLRALGYSPDGRYLASGSYDQSAVLWDARNGEPLVQLCGHQEVVRGVAFHPTQPILATGSEDGTIRLWEIPAGRCFKVLRNRRPYEGMNISQVRGLTLSQVKSLKDLGAVE